MAMRFAFHGLPSVALSNKLACARKKPRKSFVRSVKSKAGERGPWRGPVQFHLFCKGCRA